MRACRAAGGDGSSSACGGIRLAVVMLASVPCCAVLASPVRRVWAPGGRVRVGWTAEAAMTERVGEDLAGMREAFPSWNVWRSDQGGWWATRYRPLRPSRWPVGYALTVAAGDPRALREQLVRQPR